MGIAKQQIILGQIKALAPSCQANGYGGFWARGNYRQAKAIILANFNIISSPAIYAHLCFIMQWASLCVCYDDME